ncbi:sigma factor-like helix-turn-helix DNA-binding protein [Jiangella rhizosphaerae]|uniref:sigma factor-like helix-turn-helix DNA-binding protein n=1 Tax=Jiangella rhizosphaerae TaxID=2293569 RepID=UPI001F3BC135|nr:sigma factor-like helix-turn-helix DNA-binding protein [Jiangella rhizosphaerae]
MQGALAKLYRDQFSRWRRSSVLRYYEDLSEREIAAMLGCSTGTVRSQASRPSPGCVTMNLKDLLETAGDGMLDLGRLGTGPAPEVPWYEDGALHVGDRSTPADLAVEPGSDDLVVERVRDGYAVWIWEPVPDAYGRSTLTLVRDDGERIVLADGDVTPPVVSPDGERIAWGLQNHDRVRDEDALEHGLTSTVVVADAGGAVVAELPDTPSPGIRPRGFLADGRLALEAGANTAWGVDAWEPGGEVTPLRQDVGVTAMSPTGDLALLQGTDAAQLTDLATGTELWSFDDGAEARLSPDGRYLAALSWEGAPAGRPRQVVIREARTGDEVARLDVQEAGALRWESPTTVVISSYQDGSAALVRCTVGGECELATEPRQLDDDPGTYDSPYVLG